MNEPCYKTFTIGIVGTGRVGSSVGILLSRKGYRVIFYDHTFGKARKAARRARGAGAVENLREAAREADTVFLTTQDDRIAEADAEIAGCGALRPGTVVAHSSGVHASSLLSACRGRGCSVGSMHPLQTVANTSSGIRNLPGSYFCVEGDPQAVEILSLLAADLEGHLLTIPTASKPLYHAAAVMACNYFVGLVGAALDAAERIPVARDEALRALLPLIQGTVKNLAAQGMPHALTGPVARGDVRTVSQHMDIIGCLCPEVLELYKLMGSHTLKVARDRGLDQGRARELERLFHNPK
ncbi:MAG: DUF2520 domain-containing protein [Deltaproteobacteria bacterium]|nr:DUF2520 domain-containing protein [Deltaproteobacteria bacterium]